METRRAFLSPSCRVLPNFRFGTGVEWIDCVIFYVIIGRGAFVWCQSTLDEHTLHTASLSLPLQTLREIFHPHRHTNLA